MSAPTPHNAEASCTVVRLPTAASRKVRQNLNHAAYAARKELPQFRGEYLHPHQRNAMQIAKLLMEVEPSPAMELVTAILAALDLETRARVAAGLAIGVIQKRHVAEQALAVLQTTRLSIAERVDLDRAFDRLLGSQS